jgi:hypothetical protein
MNVAHQLQEIGVFVADNGLVAVLKKMSGSLVAQIENHCVTGQQAPQAKGDGKRGRQKGTSLIFKVS